ncbi:MAG: YccF domain-containing protein [Acidobacteriota bacterium]
MRFLHFLGNVLWFLLGGFIAALGYFIGSLALCITLIGIPFGIQTFKLGVASLAPFGSEVVEKEGANSALRVLFNILWIVLFGWEIALAHLVCAVVLALTILGIPFALQHIKLVPLALLPFGRGLRRVGS